MSDPFGAFLRAYDEYLDGERPYESMRLISTETMPGGSTITSIRLMDAEREALTVREPEVRQPLPVARVVRR